MFCVYIYCTYIHTCICFFQVSVSGIYMNMKVHDTCACIGLSLSRSLTHSHSDFHFHSHSHSLPPSLPPSLPLCSSRSAGRLRVKGSEDTAVYAYQSPTVQQDKHPSADKK